LHDDAEGVIEFCAFGFRWGTSGKDLKKLKPAVTQVSQQGSIFSCLQQE